MAYPITQRAPRLTRAIGQESGLTAEELDRVAGWAEAGTDRAQLAGRVDDSAIRRSHTRWLRHDAETAWLYARLSTLAGTLNAEHFGLDLREFGESFQLTLYDAAEEGFYDWHMDLGAGGVSRKLTLVIQLSHPTDYDGGELELFYTNRTRRADQQRGWLIAFPSFVMHRVMPVTRGRRLSLVAWASGPPLR